MKQTTAAIWWLNPATIFAAAGLIIGIAAYAIPEALYRTYWRMPKFFDAPGRMGSAAVCCGGAGDAC